MSVSAYFISTQILSFGIYIYWGKLLCGELYRFYFHLGLELSTTQRGDFVCDRNTLQRMKKKKDHLASSQISDYNTI